MIQYVSYTTEGFFFFRRVTRYGLAIYRVTENFLTQPKIDYHNYEKSLVVLQNSQYLLINSLTQIN